MPKSYNTDEALGAFFERQLEHRQVKAREVVYRPLNASVMFPVSYEADPGADTITYEMYSRTGMAKLIASAAADLPLVNVAAQEFTARVRSVGAAFSYSMQELRRAAMANRDINGRKQNAAIEAHRMLWNEVAFYGDASHGLNGYLTNGNIPVSSAPNGAGGDPEFSTKTADEILADLNAVTDGIKTITNGIEKADTLVLPVAQHTLISSMRIPELSTTVLEFYKKTHPGVTVLEANELSAAQLAAAGVTAFTGDVMTAYARNPDTLTMEIPQDYEQLAPQPNKLEYEVPTHSRTAGVIVYKPLSCAIMDSI